MYMYMCTYTLVNNVGVSIDADYFGCLPPEDIRRLIEVNVQSVVQVHVMMMSLLSTLYYEHACGHYASCIHVCLGF